MIVETLNIVNLRAIEKAFFRFRPGFNLIVGVNGVGKTTILDALGPGLSAVMRRANQITVRANRFSDDDIRIGTDTLEIQCSVRLEGIEHTYRVYRTRQAMARPDRTALSQDPEVQRSRRWGFIGPTPSRISGELPNGRPLAVLFSTKRAVPSKRVPKKRLAVGGVATAFADAFANRELPLGEFIAWMRVQESMRSEYKVADQVLAACERSVTRFLPDYKNLRIDQYENDLVIDRNASTIPVRFLSDGERGILALVMDLTRRLAQANPELDDPATDAQAVVLIDEIELHLHPKWQREIARNLESAFPRCQFIASTHSPQIIGEVSHDRIQMVSEGLVDNPSRSFGVDSSRILEEVMEANSRTHEIADLLSQISGMVGRRSFAKANDLLNQLIARLGEDGPEVIRLRTLLDFLEDQ